MGNLFSEKKFWKIFYYSTEKSKILVLTQKPKKKLRFFSNINLFQILMYIRCCTAFGTNSNELEPLIRKNSVNRILIDSV